VPDLDTLLAGAYAEYGWDWETGVPSEQTLDGLDLGFATDVIKDAGE
jgi:hypothetical protein